MNILQRLHDSEINAGFQAFFEGEWTAWIGDDLNGRESERGSLSGEAEAEAWRGGFLPMTALDAVDGSSAGIAMCHVAVF